MRSERENGKRGKTVREGKGRLRKAGRKWKKKVG